MPSIVLLTSYMHQRVGDLVASADFIRSILAKSKDLRIEWVIKRDISGYQVDLYDFLLKELGDFKKSVQLTVLDSRDYKQVTIRGGAVIKNGRTLSYQELAMMSDDNWGFSPYWHGWQDLHPLLRSEDMACKFRAANAIVVAANPHRLVEEDYEILHAYGKPIYTVPEYSLHHTNNIVYYPSSGDQRFSTGFAEHELGVYVDEMTKFPGGFEQIDPIDSEFLEHLLDSSVENKAEYHARATLFYGCFFEDESLSAYEYTVRVKSFIQNTILLRMRYPEKTQIDLVIPGFSDPNELKRIYKQAIIELSTDHLKQIKKVEYHAQNASNLFEAEGCFQGTGTFSIRLINPRQLQRRTVQTLLNEAEPFVGLSGDASWIEGLMKGKITCYQTVNWKRPLYNGFLKFVQQKFPAESPLRQFYEQQAPNEKSSTQRWESMREIYTQHKTEMLVEALQLARIIEKEKNLNNTMIPVLTQEIHSSQSSRERLSASQAERERAMAASIKIARERAAAAQATRERLAAEQLAPDATAEQSARDATAEKLARERLAAEQSARDDTAEKLARERLAAEQLARERLAAEQLAGEHLAAEQLAGEHLAAEQLAGERFATEQAPCERIAVERDRLDIKDTLTDKDDIDEVDIETLYTSAVKRLEAIKTQPYPAESVKAAARKEVDRRIDELLLQSAVLKNESKVPTAELANNLESTFRYLTGSLSQTDYEVIANSAHGKPSKGLKVLGGIMLALGVAIVVLGAVFSPPLLGIAPAVLTGVAIGSTSLLLGASGFGLFFKGRQKSLSAAMSNVADSVEKNEVVYAAA